MIPQLFYIYYYYNTAEDASSIVPSRLAKKQVASFELLTNTSWFIAKYRLPPQVFGGARSGTSVWHGGAALPALKSAARGRHKIVGFQNFFCVFCRPMRVLPKALRQCARKCAAPP